MLTYHDNLAVLFSMALKTEIANSMKRINDGENESVSSIYADSNLILLLLEMIDNSRLIGAEPSFTRKYLGYVSSTLSKMEGNLEMAIQSSQTSDKQRVYVDYRKELGQYREALDDFLKK